MRGARARPGVGATEIAECARCEVLVHRAAGAAGACPECGGPLARGLVEVGFADARRVYGEPGAPWTAPPPGREAPGARLRCRDGHEVRSEDERRVDDWLSERGIPHEVEPKLKGMRPDWRVGNVYVEYWGLSGQQGYEARRADKLALYRKRRLRLVEIFPEDVSALDAKLGFLLDDAGARRSRLDVEG